MDISIAIMSKVPLPGYTKTRLMPALTPEECAEFHRCCLNDIVKTAAALGWPVYLFYASPLEEPPNDWQNNQLWGIAEELYPDIIMRKQLGQDLGERMYQASLEVLGRHEAVLLLGSDLPYLPARILNEAQEKLNNCEVVLGPAEDGGYYLLGMKQAYPFLYENIPWGGSEVLTETMDRININGLSFSLLPAERDIDTWEDMENYYLLGQQREEIQNLSSYRITKKIIEKYRQRE